jgi:hypothetical protein
MSTTAARVQPRRAPPKLLSSAQRQDSAGDDHDDDYANTRAVDSQAPTLAPASARHADSDDEQTLSLGASEAAVKDNEAPSVDRLASMMRSKLTIDDGESIIAKYRDDDDDRDAWDDSFDDCASACEADVIAPPTTTRDNNDAADASASVDSVIGRPLPLSRHTFQVGVCSAVRDATKYERAVAFAAALHRRHVDSCDDDNDKHDSDYYCSCRCR